MIAGIIDSTNKAGFWEKTIGEEFEYTIASDVNGLKQCDILLVSEEYCGGAIGTVVADIQTYERLSADSCLSADFAVLRRYRCARAPST